MTAATAVTLVLFAAMITPGGGRSRTSRRVALAVVVVSVLGTGALAAAAASGGAATGAKEPVRRTIWGETKPLNAPGQDMTLQQVVIEPGAQLPEHFHEGTQLANIRSGVLTYHAVSGSVAVTRADGSNETVTGPGTVKLRRGDWIVEPESLVHYGENQGSKPVVLELVALLHDGAPLSTATGDVPDTTPLQLATLLTSESRTLYQTGPDAATTYGWNRLLGAATVDGQEVTIELLASVAYTSGSGPFSGFVTIRFPDGSSLALSMQGATVARPDGADASFAATLGVDRRHRHLRRRLRARHVHRLAARRARRTGERNLRPRPRQESRMTMRRSLRMIATVATATVDARRRAAVSGVGCRGGRQGTGGDDRRDRADRRRAHQLRPGHPRLGRARGAAGERRADGPGLDDQGRARSTTPPTRRRARARRSKLAADPTVVAVVGPYNSGVAEAVLPVLSERGVALISPSNTLTSLTLGADPAKPKRPYANYFRLVGPDSLQAAFLARAGARRRLLHRGGGERDQSGVEGPGRPLRRRVRQGGRDHVGAQDRPRQRDRGAVRGVHHRRIPGEARSGVLRWRVQRGRHAAERLVRGRAHRAADGWRRDERPRLHHRGGPARRRLVRERGGCADRDTPRRRPVPRRVPRRGVHHRSHRLRPLRLRRRQHRDLDPRTTGEGQEGDPVGREGEGDQRRAAGRRHRPHRPDRVRRLRRHARPALHPLPGGGLAGDLGRATGGLTTDRARGQATAAPSNTAAFTPRRASSARNGAAVTAWPEPEGTGLGRRRPGARRLASQATDDAEHGAGGDRGALDHAVDDGGTRRRPVGPTPRPGPSPSSRRCRSRASGQPGGWGRSRLDGPAHPGGR